MKKRLRITSLIMLIVALLWITIAFLTMDVPINLPNVFFDFLKVVYKVYPIVIILLFVASFFAWKKECWSKFNVYYSA